MLRADNDRFRTPIGQAALFQRLGADSPPPAVFSSVGAERRGTYVTAERIEERYPLSYATDGTLRGNLRFALKNEPLDLAVIHAALIAMGAAEISAWVREEPTGAYSRRIWFLYETLTGETLDLDAAPNVSYVDALDEEKHFAAAPLNSPRHRVRDNLLGSAALCPTLRRTPKLLAHIQQRYDALIKTLSEGCTSQTLARAVNFLYTKETRSSFALEGETPNPQREERFLNALRSLPDFTLTREALVALQSAIVEPRYAERDWRSVQNFVGETRGVHGEKVHFVCPRPQDVPALMNGWGRLTERVLTTPALDPVLAAALSSFAFVFIHPFEDGNGRIHRSLIHYALHRRDYGPPGFIFPVSAAILRERLLYDKALEAFSRPRLALTDWIFTADNTMQVRNDTRNLYRFFDATLQTEFLYDRVAETAQTDFREELECIVRYDAAFSAVQRIVDMPDRRLNLLLRLLMQNDGRLSRNKRGQFTELTEDELGRIENAVRDI